MFGFNREKPQARPMLPGEAAGRNLPQHEFKRIEHAYNPTERKIEKRRKLKNAVVGSIIAAGFLGAYAAASDSDNHQAVEQQGNPQIQNPDSKSENNITINIPPVDNQNK